MVRPEIERPGLSRSGWEERQQKEEEEEEEGGVKGEVKSRW